MTAVGCASSVAPELSRSWTDGGAPSLALLLAEPSRALFEGLSLRPSLRLLPTAARGDGHPVLFLPGFLADDVSTLAMRRFARRQRFKAYGWGLGRNLGASTRVREGLRLLLEDVAERHGRSVSLVGWSLGGIYARELAKALPQHVRQVVTLGSPFADVARPTNVTRLFRLFLQESGQRGLAAMADGLREPPPVPSTAIFSKTDGVAHWEACREPEAEHTENIEVFGSHCGLGVNPVVLHVLADRLSQPEGSWAPLDRSGWRGFVYG